LIAAERKDDARKLVNKVLAKNPDNTTAKRLSESLKD
jgi:hypothetical protein